MNGLTLSSLFVAAGLALAGGVELELTTNYGSERTFSIESETGWTLAVTDVEMLRNGEPFEPPEERERPTLTEERRLAYQDTVLEHEDGAPTHVRRAFGSVGTKLEIDPAPGSGERDVESPLSDVTLELERSSDGVEARVIDGATPDPEHLEGHQLDLALDALLPDGPVELGSEWELDGDMLLRALALDLGTALFPAPERPERERDGEGGRGRRGRMTEMREPVSNLLRDADWEGTATVAELDDEVDGASCVRIELQVAVEGAFDSEIEGGRGTMQSETRLELELEGELFYSTDEQRPVLLQLEGDATVERQLVRDGGERSMEIRITQQGDFSHTTLVTSD